MILDMSWAMTCLYVLYIYIWLSSTFQQSNVAAIYKNCENIIRKGDAFEKLNTALYNG